MSDLIVSDAQENWKPVVGYENWYEVSDLGRIRRVAPGRRTRPGFIRKPVPNRHGYCQIELWKDADPNLKTIHSVVCEAFIGPRPCGYDINHKNGQRDDNRLCNLEYLTRSENVRHGIANAAAAGRIHRGVGENSPSAKLNEQQVKTIKYLLSVGVPALRIARQFGVSDKAIGKIKHGETWSHVSQEGVISPQDTRVEPDLPS